MEKVKKIGDRWYVEQGDRFREVTDSYIERNFPHLIDIVKVQQLEAYIKEMTSKELLSKRISKTLLRRLEGLRNGTRLE